MSKINGSNIILYTEEGLITYSTSASLNYSNDTYEVLPNSYSKKRKYGIPDWTISGEFFYDTNGNYDSILDRINKKEVVSVLIVENTTNYKFGYGVVSSVSINSANENTVAFSIEILGSSKLSGFNTVGTAFSGSFDVLRLIDNQFYKAGIASGNLDIYYYGGGGRKNILSISVANDTIQDFIKIDDSFLIVTDVEAYIVNKNGYVENTVSTFPLSKPRKVFDSQDNLIAMLESNTTINVYSKSLILDTTITATNILDYVQLSNSNYLIATTTGFLLKDTTNTLITTGAAFAMTSCKLFISNNGDVYAVTNAGLRYFTSLEQDLLTTSEISATSFQYINNIEGGYVIAIDFNDALLFKGSDIKSFYSGVIPSGDSLIETDFEMDSNGVIYSLDSLDIVPYIPVELGLGNDYDMPLNKLL